MNKRTQALALVAVLGLVAYLFPELAGLASGELAGSADQALDAEGVALSEDPLARSLEALVLLVLVGGGAAGSSAARSARKRIDELERKLQTTENELGVLVDLFELAHRDEMPFDVPGALAKARKR